MENVTKIASVVFLLSFYSSSFAFGELCKHSNDQIPKELRFTEESYNSSNVEKAFEYLEIHFPEIIKTSKSVNDLLNDSSYYISYPNNVTILKGHILLLDLENSYLKYKFSEKNNSNKELLKKSFSNKLKKYCEFSTKEAVVVD